MKSIFESTKLGNLNIKNRLFRSATWDGLVNQDGTLPDEVYNIYEELAVGGVGAIITALTDVSPHDTAKEGNMRLFSDSLILDYKRLTDIVHKHDCKIMTQLNMNRYKKLDGNNQIITVEINELTKDDIKDIVDYFAAAATRAKKARFDGIQIHSCFGWILNRSINPKYNQRTDEYGGTAENRIRISLEVLTAIRHSVPDMHISTKIEYYGDINNEAELNDFAIMCGENARHGLNSMEISVNWGLLGREPENEAGFLKIAMAVSEYTDIPIILVGGHRHIESMEQILNETPIEYFSLSCPLIMEAGLPNRWKKGDRSPAKCISCDAYYRTHGKRCKFNIKGY